MTRSNTLRRHSTRSRLAVLSTGAALTLALAGCGASAGDDDDLPEVTPGPAMSTPASSTDTGGDDSASHDAPAEDADLTATDFPVSPDQAVKTALGSDGGAVVTKVELDHSREHGGWVYEIDTQNGTEQHEVTVHATSGEIVADKTDTEDDPAVEVDLSKLAPEDAMAAANGLQAGTVSGWTLGTDDGTTGYTVEIRNGTDDVDVWVSLDGSAMLKD